MIPSHTSTLHTTTPPDALAPRLQEAVAVGIFSGDVGARGFLLGAGPRLSQAASPPTVPLALQPPRPSAITTATLTGRWDAAGGGSVLTVRYVPPVQDLVFLVLVVIIVGPVAIEAWARPEVGATLRWGALAALVAGCAAVVALSWARMRRLRWALRQVCGA